MKNFLLVCACFGFLPSFVVAAVPDYKLKFDLSIDGKAVASPSLLVKEGEPAFITQSANKKGESTFIEVVATQENPADVKAGIFMKFVVGKIVNGKREILAQPQIVAAENMPASISIRDAKGSDSKQLYLAVKANKIVK